MQLRIALDGFLYPVQLQIQANTGVCVCPTFEQQGVPEYMPCFSLDITWKR